MKKNLKIGKINVSLELRGNLKGKPLIFLHGWGGNKNSWDNLILELSKRGAFEKHCTVAVDLPGFGESDEPPEAWSVNDYAVFTEELLSELYKKFLWSENYSLIVHSFGGRVLFKLFSKNFNHKISQSPNKLVLIAAAGIKRPLSLFKKIISQIAKLVKKVIEFPLFRPLQKFAKRTLYRVLRSHDYENSNGIMRSTFLKVIDEDLSENLNYIKKPTLIFWGAKDSYVPVKDAKIMTSKIQNSRLTIFPDGKHGIHKTKSDLIADEIIKFL